MKRERLREVVSEEIYSSRWNEEHQKVDYLVDALWPVLMEAWDDGYEAAAKIGKDWDHACEPINPYVEVEAGE